MNKAGTKPPPGARPEIKVVGIDVGGAHNMALCALVAYHVATGKECVSYGEADTGLIITPSLQHISCCTQPFPEVLP